MAAEGDEGVTQGRAEMDRMGCVGVHMRVGVDGVTCSSWR